MSLIILDYKCKECGKKDSDVLLDRDFVDSYKCSKCGGDTEALIPAMAQKKHASWEVR